MKPLERTTRAVADDAQQRAAGAGVGNVITGTAPALVNGASPAPIPAPITADSMIFLTLRTPIGTPGFPNPTNQIPGQPGSFTIASTSVNDNSVYDYIITAP